MHGKKFIHYDYKYLERGENDQVLETYSENYDKKVLKFDSKIRK